MMNPLAIGVVAILTVDTPSLYAATGNPSPAAQPTDAR
jgi:hypothetical protein